MGETDDGKGAVNIPQWQRKSDSSDPKRGPDDLPAQDSKPLSRAPLLQQATKFLEDDEIRDASTDRKIAFLESKGLTTDEIQELLGVSRVAEASATASARQEHDEVTSSEPQRIETPPIITYPEFLSQASGRPPLITAGRLLNTLYVAGTLAASIYGISRYVVEPMTDALNESRHSLAERAKDNLEKLNTRLEESVSEVPMPKAAGHMRDSDADSTASSDSDPTELFHVDIGTQTSSRRSSASTSTDPTPRDALSRTLAQQATLKTMSSHLTSLLETSASASDADDGVAASLQELRTFLDGIVYASPYAATNASLYSSVIGPAGAGAARVADDDAVGKIKGEIRGIKGVLLSARNFPASQRGRGVGVRS
ncbi:MAG: hypothetical protein M1832_001642 [Thelocarpon impressellum]|nr:MAG: hypothetical protein M1832_001642 [Thelocarpon impressellum]